VSLELEGVKQVTVVLDECSKRFGCCCEGEQGRGGEEDEDLRRKEIFGDMRSTKGRGSEEGRRGLCTLSWSSTGRSRSFLGGSDISDVRRGVVVERNQGRAS
jgi:hypothetical protein